jgi:ketosteroid isomerase-like protein
VSDTGILQRMERAMNAHDLDGFVDCFTEDFVAEHPIHPQRSFVGNEQVRRNWAGVFANVPDLAATVLQSVVDGERVWSEWDIRGNTRDGGRYQTPGVAILSLRDGRIASVRFYLDYVAGTAGANRDDHR